SALDASRYDSFQDVYTEAATFRPRFSAPEEYPRRLKTVPLTGGGAGPVLIGCTGSAATGGPQEFSRLANALRGAYPVSALPLPGYRVVDGAPEPLPSALDAVLDLQAQAPLRSAGAAHFVLVHYSHDAMLALGHVHRTQALY